MSDADVYANVAELPDSDCTVDTLIEDKFFICVSATIISPSFDSATHYFDALTDGALVSLSKTIKTLLDSGCTAHIFKEKKFFWSYREDEAVDIKTANCGVLSTLAHGEIRIRVRCSNGKHVVICLLDCLHALAVPMNLISVGTLTERKMFLTFGNNWTSVHFPKDHSSLAGIRFSMKVHGHLSFIDCKILEPPSSVDSPSCLVAIPEPFC